RAARHALAAGRVAGRAGGKGGGGSEALNDKLFAAIGEGNFDLGLKLFAEGGQINFQGKKGYTPLSRARSYRNSNLCNLLINRGANIHDASDEFGVTPLMSAAAAGLHDVCRSMIKKGAQVNARDTDGDTALWYAAREGRD